MFKLKYWLGLKKDNERLKKDNENLNWTNAYQAKMIGNLKREIESNDRQVSRAKTGRRRGP